MTERHLSDRYLELAAVYRDAHENGLVHDGKRLPSVFTGKSLKPHIKPIAKLVRDTSATSLLDYGCGKAMYHSARDFELDGEQIESLHSYWGVTDVALFDPGVVQHSNLPEGMFDAVISTDVLEHVDEGDVDFVLNEIFSKARKFVYMNISTRPAAKVLPNGENAHATVKPGDWWKERVAKCASDWNVPYCCALEHGGQIEEVIHIGF